MKNSISWILWSIFTISLLLTTRNPIYLIVTIISMLILGYLISAQKKQAFWLKGNIRFLFTMILISGLINTLFAHTGSSVIFSLPESWLLVGGDITFESLIYGLINGLIIAALYLVFNILNLALSIKQMTRLIPVALKPIAMTITVALTFFPSVQQRAREIKEAQMIRGNPMKRVADWLPLIIPLLMTSLENAFLLAESMTARGFHIQRSSTSNEASLIGMILGLFSIFSGWILRLYDYSISLSIFLYIFGGLIFLFVFWRSRRAISTTRYHHEAWTVMDIFFSTFFFLTSVTMFLLQSSKLFPSFSYSPYPTIQVPGFHLIVLMLSLVPLSPAFFYSHD